MKHRDEGAARGRKPDGYVRRTKLEDDLDLHEVALRQAVKRTRDTVAEALEALGEAGLFDQLLVETRSGHGYRLNPSVRVFDEADPGSMSRRGAKT